MALLSYRATPMPWCGLSPAELLMGRRIRTDHPQTTASLMPQWSHVKNFRTLDEQYKRSQKRHYDLRHRVRELPPLPEDQPVWVETRGVLTPGRVLHAANTPRSYVVETPSGGQLRRNRSHLRIQSNRQETIPQTESMETPCRPVTCSQIGTIIHPPN